MSKFWSDVVRQVEPYVPGEQPKITGLIKLNTNESPYPPSPQVAKTIDRDAIDQLRLYPDPSATELSQAVADYYQLEANQVFVGNGSDEVLAQLFMAFFQGRGTLLYPDISYSFYPVYCQLFGVPAQKIPLRADFSLALEDYHGEAAGVIFPNPNAPTGMGLALTEIEALLRARPNTLVVVDEAYIDFGGQTAASLVPHYDNLLVVQTFSKSRALAGLRVGFALGQRDLIEGLERVKNSFNSYPLDRLAQRAATAAIQDDDYFHECCGKVVATRNRMADALLALGFSVLPSQANFIFAKPPASVTAEAMAAQLREKKILVRYFKQARISDYLRISVGTDEQTDVLLAALESLLAVD
ncbi:histidinol-phosphate transaminase [Gilvimarinus polysaccharolyticus]|uniref:histidinol-phosphate transaminase n=1 Tax=Gilvimarinus polysaccharolyticus TaxID=863921 RepID=UPI0006732B89|nr:histidinol-phosphate transaminase [Gilvimarinus polysaccharolyticus]